MSATWRAREIDPVNSHVDEGVRRIANFIKVMADRLRARHLAAETIRQLRQLDDRLLCDIGASRTDVRRPGRQSRGIGDTLGRLIDPRV